MRLTISTTEGPKGESTSELQEIKRSWEEQSTPEGDKNNHFKRARDPSFQWSGETFQI